MTGFQTCEKNIVEVNVLTCVPQHSFLGGVQGRQRHDSDSPNVVEHPHVFHVLLATTLAAMHILSRPAEVSPTSAEGQLGNKVTSTLKGAGG